MQEDSLTRASLTKDVKASGVPGRVCLVEDKFLWEGANPGARSDASQAGGSKESSQRDQGRRKMYQEEAGKPHETQKTEFPDQHKEESGLN